MLTTLYIPSTKENFYKVICVTKFSFSSVRVLQNNSLIPILGENCGEVAVLTQNWVLIRKVTTQLVWWCALAHHQNF
jgi:hypothetical protein